MTVYESHAYDDSEVQNYTSGVTKEPKRSVNDSDKEEPHKELEEEPEPQSSEAQEPTESDEGSENGFSDSEGDGSDTSDSIPEFNNRRIILQRFTIYNSLATMYIVGSNAKESLFRILEINKDPNDDTNLTIIEDKSYFYTRKDMVDLINGLNETIEGGIHKIAQGYGLLGLIKFTKGYYLSLITKCSQVAVIGGHFIYHIDETKSVPLDLNYRRPNKYTDEEKLLSIFKYLDLGKTFYFSYSYDITNTLQTNFVRNKKLASYYQRAKGEIPHNKSSFVNEFDSFQKNDRFVWNKMLLSPIQQNEDVATYEWFQPIIHGFIDQANVSIYGKKIYITIIARRSQHFAGARFLKRGVNHEGNVANEIETEQIVTDMLISSFHDPKYGFYNNPRFTSFVQHRGSIPLYWTQDLNRLPKPPIEINLSDPFHSSSALHFNNLFERYGSPVIILNLIKTKEKTPRESKLNKYFIDCINYLNQSLPEEHKLQFNSFDMSKHSKKNLDVIGPLQTIAEKSILQIGFFHNGIDLEGTKLQNGIIRTNCIDCLDRTNAAQFIICKEVLSHQLASLGLISEPTSLAYDSDLINILTEIFHDHGDTIAIQYGGSNLVNTMDSYRRINQWSSHTRDMLNSVKRIYSNSFMDSIRQEAINLFLGNYIYDPKKPKLWELQNDFYLHNNMSNTDVRRKISYIHWYNSHYLSKERYDLTKDIPTSRILEQFTPFIFERLKPYPEFNDNWFNECYVPRKYQSFTDLFMFNMNSNLRYFPSNVSNKKNFDYSPFESRKQLIKREDNGYEPSSPVKSKPSLNEFPKKSEQYEDSDSDSESVGSETKMSKLDANSSYNYLNITNTNKIKNLLTSGMEKLGYSRVNGYPKKDEYKFSSSAPNTRNNDHAGDGSSDSSLTTVSDSDREMYSKHLKFSSYTLQDSIPDSPREAPSVDSYNMDLYRKYTTVFDEADYDQFSSDIYSRFYDVFSSSMADYSINAKYLDNHIMELAQDDYFT
ncbi:hypothetical protein CANTEDRAFT_102631 [Yamadazyma tenuis ATCC 10573]|uniref:SAC domain-containing protein n=2 Tax=Candida tenuis TaxID=2315449 RepID=G3B088_CANTC|nr:uncharacterized protein CANTEDRAFT_102631 [Yamadazyma tenuis ATCC 10573]EGV65344.1 hypothetical protein CANTEDRAFT_102631 [Yamadazyma tenuis ATCC 10573]